MTKAKHKKPVQGSGQLSLLKAPPPAKVPRTRAGLRFTDPSPSLVLINNTPLDTVLVGMGHGFVLKLRTLIRALDWTEFKSRYKGGGRDPFHPALMISLIVFGLLNGHSSLREIEQFAKTDMRCWWLSGGLMPDYSTFCRFLIRHQNLVFSFFEVITAVILKETKGSADSVAVDGTIMQAAGSRLRTITAEAAQVAAATAKAKAEKAKAKADKEEIKANKAKADAILADEDTHPTSGFSDAGLKFEEAAAQAAQQAAQAQAAASHAERVAEIAQATRAQQHAKGRKNATGRVCFTEPEAPIRKLKSGGVAPSYNASAMANRDRIITGCAVDPQSETAVVGSMLEQSARVSPESVSQLFADGGFIGLEVLELAVDNNIDLLCPQGRARGDDDWAKKPAKGLFPKSRFVFDEAKNSYICPEGQELAFKAARKAEAFKLPYDLYAAKNCGSCKLKPKCTKAANRTVRRYASDPLKEVMQEVMDQPNARKRYRQRKAMIEPVFAEMRGAQKFNRFKRRGLVKVQMEWALNCVAYNLRRLRVKWKAQVAVLLILCFAFAGVWGALQFALGRLLLQRGPNPVPEPA